MTGHLLANKHRKVTAGASFCLPTLLCDRTSVATATCSYNLSLQLRHENLD